MVKRYLCATTVMVLLLQEERVEWIWHLPLHTPTRSPASSRLITVLSQMTRTGLCFEVAIRNTPCRATSRGAPPQDHPPHGVSPSGAKRRMTIRAAGQPAVLRHLPCGESPYSHRRRMAKSASGPTAMRLLALKQDAV
jgi:hypothetical protein